MPGSDDDQDMSLGEAAQHLTDWLAGKEVPGRKIKASVEKAVEVLSNQPTTVPTIAGHFFPYQYQPPDEEKPS